MYQQTIVLEVEESDQSGSSRYRVEVSGVEHETRKIAEELLDKLKNPVVVTTGMMESVEIP